MNNNDVIITIMRDGDHYLMKWTDLRMVEAYGGYGIKSYEGILFVNMQELASFVNNEMGLGVLFAVE